MRSSELGSVRSLRRFPSVGTESAAVVSRASVAQQYPYNRFLHRCQKNLHEKFQRREFHTTKEKVFTKTNLFSCGRSVLLLSTTLVGWYVGMTRK